MFDYQGLHNHPGIRGDWAGVHLLVLSCFLHLCVIWVLLWRVIITAGLFFCLEGLALKYPDCKDDGGGFKRLEAKTHLQAVFSEDQVPDLRLSAAREI